MADIAVSVLAALLPGRIPASLGEIPIFRKSCPERRVVYLFGY